MTLTSQKMTLAEFLAYTVLGSLDLTVDRVLQGR